MFGEIAYLIEGYQSTIYFLLFVIGFNPCNIYALFYGAPVYGNISISPELGNWVGDFVRKVTHVIDPKTDRNRR